jgi:hypothetical protein
MLGLMKPPAPPLGDRVWFGCRLKSRDTRARKLFLEGEIGEKKISMKLLTMPRLYGLTLLSYLYLKFSYVVWLVLMR